MFLYVNFFAGETGQTILGGAYIYDDCNANDNVYYKTRGGKS